jgi:8-oxo-dGTP pyrophosphatase MutT (NUDIX family)
MFIMKSEHDKQVKHVFENRICTQKPQVTGDIISETPTTITSTCSNCGKMGHLFYQCKLPITSYGIILFRQNNHSDIEYLMIRRKDSFGYIDFIRGKYSLNSVFQIQKCIDEMSNIEKERVITLPFEELWNELWGDNSMPLYRSEEATSSKKFESLKNGIVINNERICLEDLVNKSITTWNDQEWEFPKGRRNYKENDMECALREFEEETGIDREDIQLIENIIPYEEYFIGSNFKSYKHKFYLAYTDLTNVDMGGFQKTEVSKMEWMTIDTCLQHIRPYNLEKKTIISNISKMLKSYSFYS